VTCIGIAAPERANGQTGRESPHTLTLRRITILSCHSDKTIGRVEKADFVDLRAPALQELQIIPGIVPKEGPPR